MGFFAIGHITQTFITSLQILEGPFRALIDQNLDALKVPTVTCRCTPADHTVFQTYQQPIDICKQHANTR